MMATRNSPSARVKANEFPHDRITLESVKSFANTSFPLAFRALPDVKEIEFVNLGSVFEQEEQEEPQTLASVPVYSPWPTECQELVMSIGYLNGDSKIYAFLYGRGRTSIGYIYQDKRSGVYKRHPSTSLCGVRFEGPFLDFTVNVVLGTVHRRLRPLLIFYKLLAGHIDCAQWDGAFDDEFKRTCEAKATVAEPRNMQDRDRNANGGNVGNGTPSTVLHAAVPEKRPRTLGIDNKGDDDSRPLKRSTYEQGVYNLVEAQKQLNQLQAEYCTASSSNSHRDEERVKLLDRITELEENANRTKRENDALLKVYKDRIDAAKCENQRIHENNAERMSATRAMAEASIKEIQKKAENRVKEAQNSVEMAIWQGQTAAKAELQEEMDKMKGENREESRNREQAEKKYKELEETQKKMRELLGWK